MELTEYLSVLRKRWITVVLLAVAGLAAGALASLMAVPTYHTATRMFFTVNTGDSIGEMTQGTNFADQQLSSYSEVAKSPMVLDPVIEELGLDTNANALAGSIDVSRPGSALILDITATSSDPERAAELADSVADHLVDVVAELAPQNSEGEDAVAATVLSPASVPGRAASPNIPLNLGLGVGMGVLLGIGLAVLRETLDTKIRVDKDIAQVTDATVIGNIAFEDTGTGHPVFMHDDPRGQRAEAIRRLRTNLQFVNLNDRPNSIVVTSSVPGEGKSTTAINVAISMADAGAKVILIDADLRKPSIGEYLGIESRAGLTTVLIGRAELDEVVHQGESPTLHVLPSGQIPPNPSELLGSRAMSTLLAQLTAAYDHVIIDSPPLLPVTDAAVLSKLTGGALVIAGADRIHKAQLRESMDALERVDAHVLGVVLNKVERRERGKYYYTYGEYNEPEDGSINGRPNRTVAETSARSTWPGQPLAQRR
ncbi:polysaccharide biosynthesis tyrosine autokinase [Georgenia alba]|uniref:non-specific protein-tyrosine kinase n=1 Tax=Georgenia alba TaxID=2233858 RepID=A0ABW2Q566_9MICO